MAKRKIIINHYIWCPRCDYKIHVNMDDKEEKKDKPDKPEKWVQNYMGERKPDE